MNCPLERMRLAVVTHVVHYRWGGKLYAYAAYAREIEIWADLFRAVVIAAPVHEQAPPGDCIPLVHQNIAVRPQLEAGGDSLEGKVGLLLSLPAMIFRIATVLRGADAIHVRCPGNLGVLGAALGPLFSRNLVAKYAGQWTDYPGEARTTRWQKRLLRSRWFSGPVTVYGKWPDMPDHVVPFFTSVLSAEQINRARTAARRAFSNGPLRVLFVGRLTAAKNVAVLLEAIAEVRRLGADVRCAIVGEGPERPSLELLCAKLSLGAFVEFVGGVDFNQTLGYFERSDALVLASETEGWPKAITEAMAFGLVCVGSNRGLVPQILAEGRGLVVPPRDVNALASAIHNIAIARNDYAPMRERAAAWAQQYSLEGLREALREILVQRWRLAPQQASVAMVGS